MSVLDNPKLYEKDPHNDKFVLETLHDVLSKSDIIVAHNGNDYDIKFVTGRMLVQGLSPLPPIPQIDTLKVAREKFLLNANNLDYLGNLLGVGRKIHTTKGLWLEALKGNKKAIEQMVIYNKGDIRLLKRIYLKLQPYISHHPNVQLFGAPGKCPRCGSTHVQSRGIHHSLTQSYRRFQCIDCAGWFRERKSSGRVETRII